MRHLKSTVLQVAMASLWLSAAVGCTADTGTLFIDVRTDLVPGAEFNGVRVDLGALPEDAIATLDMDFLTGQRVARFDDLARGSVQGVVQLLSASGVVLERRFTVELRSAPQTMTIVISRDCRGVMCPGSGSPRATACLAGSCVDPRCSVELPELCEVDECTAPADCELLDPCSEVQCELGACLYGDGDRCGDGSYCNPDRGCVLLPMTDAGAGDASMDALADAIDPDGGPGDAGDDAGCTTCPGGSVCFDGTCFPSDGCTEVLGVPCDEVLDAYIKSSNAEASDGLGFNIALSGDTLAVASIAEASSARGVNGEQNDNTVPSSGAVYVFRRAGNQWHQEAYLKASNTEEMDWFGWTLSLNGDTLAVGAPLEDSAATGVDGDQGDNSAGTSGAVYVFQRTDTEWSQQAYIKASNTGPGDQFGSSVSLNGDALAVGAPGEFSGATGVGGDQGDNSALASGAAYLFRRVGAVWTQEAYFKASNTGRADSFGLAVGLSGDTLAVSATAEDSAATGVGGDETNNAAGSSGAVYVFRRSGGTWAQEAYIKASNTGASDGFGWSLSLSGNTLAVGAESEQSASTGVNGDGANDLADRSGAVYVFRRSGVTWVQEAYLKASNTNAGDRFGYRVSLDGDTLAIGAIHEDSGARNVNGDETDNTTFDSGAVYLFRRVGASWTQRAYLKAYNTDETDRLGRSVALSGSLLALGAMGESSRSRGVDGNPADNSLPDSGAAYVLRVAP